MGVDLVVYVDSPWSFTNQKTGGSHSSGASQKYPVMSLAAIQQLSVPDLVRGQRAVLFLWVPTRLKFSHGATTLAAWGFSYETTVYWHKLYPGKRMGMGFWLRNCVEELLVATHGDVAPFRCQLPNLVSVPVEDHSTKPEAFRRLIDTAVPERRKAVELFARRTTPGWWTGGHVVTGQDIRADLRWMADQVRTWRVQRESDATG